MTTVILWRHGRTEYNATRRLQGQVDIPLDEVGEWQAKLAARALSDQLPQRPVIVSSDLQRAVSTAALLAEPMGVDVVLDHRLRERGFGEWEGLTGSEIKTRWPDDHAAWTAGLDPKRSGAESRAEVAERVSTCIEEHAADAGTVVIVSHGAAITLAITALIELDAVNWRGLGGLDNAHWSVLVGSAPDRAPRWRLTRHNLGPAVSLGDWNSGEASV